MNGSHWNATPEPGRATRLLHDDGTEALPLSARVADPPNVIAWLAPGPPQVIRIRTIDAPVWRRSFPLPDDGMISLGAEVWADLMFGPGDRARAEEGWPTRAWLPLSTYLCFLRPAAALHAA